MRVASGLINLAHMLVARPFLGSCSRAQQHSMGSCCLGFRSPPPISRANNGYCLTHIYVARNMASEHTTAQITPTRVPKDEEAEIAVESRVRQAPKAARAQNETITQLHADTTAETASLYSKAADLHRAERAVSTPPNAQRRPRHRHRLQNKQPTPREQKFACARRFAAQHRRPSAAAAQAPSGCKGNRNTVQIDATLRRSQRRS